jgi:hypothetical protein
MKYSCDKLPRPDQCQQTEYTRDFFVFEYFRFVTILEKEIVLFRSFRKKLIHILNWLFVTGVNKKPCEKCLTAVMKAREKHIQARNSERSVGVRGFVDIGTPRMTDHISLPWRMLCTYLHCYGP